MIDGIFGFFDDSEKGLYYRFLSNFWYVDVEFDGEVYPSVEHAYQAAKSLSEHQRQCIRQLGTPSEAKKLGKRASLREDWEEVKVPIMKMLVEQKFQRPDLRQKLVATGNLYLEETNTWGDTFWGVCNNRGKNVLGNILMDIRSKLRLTEGSQCYTQH